MAKAECEPLVSVIRIWADDTAVYGDPYDWVATVRWIDQKHVEVLGYVKPITPSFWHALNRCLGLMGVEQLKGVKYKDGKRIEKWYAIPRPTDQVYGSEVTTENRE